MANPQEIVFESLGPVFEVCLLFILTKRRRIRRFPAFAVFLAADCLTTVPTIAASFLSQPSTFRTLYFGSDIIFFGLQLWVIYEMALQVIQSAGRWNAKARSRFLMYAVFGALAALAAAFVLDPPGYEGFRLALLRLEVFGELLMTEAVIAMMAASGNFGMGWSSHVMAIGQGMMVLALTTVTVDTVGLYLPRAGFTAVVGYARGTLYLLTLLYWCVALWHDEPERKPISPALRKYIVALHDQVQYDLGKVGH